MNDCDNPLISSYKATQANARQDKIRRKRRENVIHWHTLVDTNTECGLVQELQIFYS